jgi:uncharacterized PurR-regulated membrane protein YhhQ (DUF165 family)
MAAIFFYVMLRCFLIYWFDMKSNLSGVGSEFTLNNTLQFLAIGILTFFEGFWLLILLFFGVLWSRRDYLRLLIISLPLIVIIAVAFCVADITRSGAFAVPIIFIIFSYLNNFFTNEELRKILSVCFIFSFLIPPIFVCSDWGLPEWFQKPSFMILVEFIKNRILYG